MFGPKVHLVAAAAVATIAFTFGGTSGASAGMFGNNCCTPVTWGCQSTCATMPNIVYGTAPNYYLQPAYRVNQGPVYEPPALSDGEQDYQPEAVPQYQAYPYVSPYSYGYYGPRYRRFGPRVHYGIYSSRRYNYGVTSHRSFQRYNSGPHYRTAMYPNRQMTRGPVMHRAPMTRSRHH